MKRNSSKIIAGLIALGLLVVLTIQLIKVPMFMYPSFNLLVMFIMGLLIGSLIVAGIVKIFFKKTSLFILLCLVTSLSTLVCMYKFYSPTLNLVIPKGYVGQVSLVLSNIDENILTVDSNGIGYINKRTFDKVYKKPEVHDTDGTDISNLCVGFNPSTFWGKGKTSVTSTDKDISIQEIQFKSFEVVPKEKKGRKQYYHTNLAELVDKSKLY